MNSFYQKYLLPGLVFQGIVIGGGYSTGRELAEFFMPHGFLGGLLSMLVAALVWCLVMAVSFENHGISTIDKRSDPFSV